MNMVSLLKELVRERPQDVALIDTHRGIPRYTTFSDLDTATNQVAGLFRQHGIGPGDAMLVFCPLSRELYVILLALFRLGAIATFLDPSAGSAHIDRCCRMYSIKASICPPKAHLLRFVSPALRRVPQKFSTTIALPGAVSLNRAKNTIPCEEIYPVEDDAPALITFTSGSTGHPKMLVRTHGLLLAQHRAIQQTTGMKSGSLNLSTLPVFVLSNLACGASTLLPGVDLRRPGDVDPRALTRQIVCQRPHSLTAAPAFLETLADFCLQEDLQLPYLNRIYCGGAPVFPTLIRKLKVIAPLASVTAVYGATEAEPIASLSRSEVNAQDLEDMAQGKGLLVGRPVSAIKLRVIRDHWGTQLGPLSADELASLTCQSGEPGEIVVSGEHVLTGYINGDCNWETTLTVERTSWFRTGDSGYLDADGRLWLLGRCEAVLTDARGSLYPLAVECAAQLLAKVRRTALVSDLGKRTLLVERMPGSSTIDCAALRKQLSWAPLDCVRSCRKIPVDRRHNSKVDYTELRRILASREAGA